MTSDLPKRTKPKILSRRKIAHSKLFMVEKRHLLFENGKERVFERIIGRRGGSVMIVPVIDNERFFLIREYGAGVDDYYLGFPKGIIDEGETPNEAANRELKEEIGYGARKFTSLKSMVASPGYMAGSMRLILAEDLFEEKLIGDEPEKIDVLEWRFDALDELMAREDFCEARSIAAVLLVREMLNGK